MNVAIDALQFFFIRNILHCYKDILYTKISLIVTLVCNLTYPLQIDFSICKINALCAQKKK